MSVRTIQLILEATDRASAEIRQVRGAVAGIGDGLARIPALAASVGAALGVAFGAREIVGFLIDTNRETQRLLAQLETFEGTGAKAEAVFQRMEQMASSTPFAIDQLVEAYVRLRSVGIQPTEQMMVAFGDTAAANTRNVVDFAEAVVGATVGEMERLKQFGIVARQEGDKVTFHFRGRTIEITKDAASIVAALEEIGRSQFAGGMERQMNTLNGQISNLMDNVSTIARIIGDEGGLNQVLAGVIGRVSDFTGEVSQNTDAVAGWTSIFVTFGKLLLDTILFLPKVFFQVGQGLAALFAAFWADLNFLVAQGVVLLQDTLNKIPGVDLNFIDQSVADFWLGEVEKHGRGMLKQAQDLAGLVDGWTQSLADFWVAIELRDMGRGRVGVTLDEALRRHWGIAGDKQLPPPTGGGSGPGSGSAGSGDEWWSMKFAKAGAARGPAAAFALDHNALLEQMKIYDSATQARRDFLALQAEDLAAAAYQASTLADQIRQDLLFGLVNVFEMLGKGLVGGLGGFDSALRALGGSVASTLGDMMINAGTTIVLTDGAFKALAASLARLVPGGAIGHGLALIAAGAALKHGIGSFLSNPTGKGGGGGGFGSSLSGTFQSIRGVGDQKVVNIYLPDGGILNMNDFRQREAFKRMLRELTGTGEIRLQGI